MTVDEAMKISKLTDNPVIRTLAAKRASMDLKRVLADLRHGR